MPLIKYIDAAGPLSVQVHPKGIEGKDELWIIDEVYEDPEVYIGFRRSISKETFEAFAKNGDLFSLMQKISVSPGDVLYIPGGMIHGAKGISFLEIQHSRDVTYRIYDYGRGRPIQWEEGCRALHFAPDFLRRSRIFSPVLDEFLEETPFSFCPVVLHGVYCKRAQKDLAVVVMKGQGWLNEIPFQKGDCFFVRKGEFLSFFGESVLLLCDAAIISGNV